MPMYRTKILGIKGMAANLRAYRLKDVAFEIETAAKNGESLKVLIRKPQRQREVEHYEKTRIIRFSGL